MKFLCLGYFDQEKMGVLPKESNDAVMGKCEPHMKVFHGTGKVLLDAELTLETVYLHRVHGEVISHTNSDTTQSNVLAECKSLKRMI